MYVAITGSGKNRVIQFREDKRIPGTTRKKTNVIKTLGNYERMLAEDPDIIVKLTEEARRLTLEKKESQTPISLDAATNEILDPSMVVPSYNFGHALVLQLWDRMKLDPVFTDKTGKRDEQQVKDMIFYLLLHRMSDPASVRASAFDQPRYAGLEELKLDRFYDVLPVLDAAKEELIAHLGRFFARHTDRSSDHGYYDVTTYAFESTRWGELRMFGFSKDHKNNEVQVVMGLLLDNNGIPITYELFPGTTMDQNTLVDAVNNLKAVYRLDKITIVADRGLNSGANLNYLVENEHDFVISYTLKRSSADFKALVFAADSWTLVLDETTGELVSKSKIIDHQLDVKVPLDPAKQETVKKRGRPRKYEIKTHAVKIHLTWSAKRAAKDRMDRERILERLRQRLDKPYQLKAAIRRGSNQYLQMELDTKNWQLDEAKIEEAARYDGYYAVITNKLSLDTEAVVKIYSGLWKIEESFRVLQTDLRACPVFVWNDEHVKGHFAMCFIALCIVRYTQYLLERHQGRSVSAAYIMSAIRDPLALVQGAFPHTVVTPTQVPQTYIDLAKILNLPTLKTNMTLTQFRSSTKLNLTRNLK